MLLWLSSTILIYTGLPMTEPCPWLRGNSYHLLHLYPDTHLDVVTSWFYTQNVVCVLWCVITIDDQLLILSPAYQASQRTYQCRKSVFKAELHFHGWQHSMGRYNCNLFWCSQHQCWQEQLCLKQRKVSLSLACLPVMPYCCHSQSQSQVSERHASKISSTATSRPKFGYHQYQK